MHLCQSSDLELCESLCFLFCLTSMPNCMILRGLNTIEVVNNEAIGQQKRLVPIFHPDSWIFICVKQRISEPWGPPTKKFAGLFRPLWSLVRIKVMCVIMLMFTSLVHTSLKRFLTFLRWCPLQQCRHRSLTCIFNSLIKSSEIFMRISNY